MILKKSAPLLRKENQTDSGKYYGSKYFSEFDHAASGHLQIGLFIYKAQLTNMDLQ